MGLRFRRSFQLLPGIRLNVSKSGVSTSIGRRGATVNIGRGRTSVTLGIPGTGLSYRSSAVTKATRQARAANATTSATTYVSQSISTGKDTGEAAYQVTPEEAVYRVAALLAAVLIGSADADAVTVRIAGLLPERLTPEISSPMIAKQLVARTLAQLGASSNDTMVIRKVIEKTGLRGTALVREAVAAVRASVRARASASVDTSAPMEWLRIDGQLQCREFEAPAVNARIPRTELDAFHAKQIDVGRERLANEALYRPQRKPILRRLLGVAVCTGIAVACLLVIALVSPPTTTTHSPTKATANSGTWTTTTTSAPTATVPTRTTRNEVKLRKVD